MLNILFNSYEKVQVKSLSHARLFETPWTPWTPWTVGYQAPPSMGFSRKEYWSGLPLPSPLQLWKPPEITKRANNRMIKKTFTYSR